MELDKALHFAVILGWDELMRAGEPRSVRVEYQGKPGTSLDNVRVWSSKVWGYHELVCDYWGSATSTHPSGISFKKGYNSDKLAESLDFIMKNQNQFTRTADAGGNGLVLVDAPAADESKEATAWMNQAHGIGTILATPVH